MKTTTRPIVSNILPLAAIVSVYALCGGMCRTAYAQQDVPITVTTTAQQTFDGFGINISNPFGEFVPAGGRKGTTGTLSAQLYDGLFKSNDANSCKISFLRLGMNSSNYKISPTAAYDFNTSVEKFGQGDIIRAARARNSALKIVLAGTPAYWMKYNNADYNEGAYSTDPNISTTNRLKTDQYGNYVNLLKTYCDNFNTKFGFYPHAVGLQNEPETDIGYPSCVFTADQYKTMLTAARNVFPWGYPTKLWGPELTGNKDINYIATVATAGLLDAIGAHSYDGDTGLIPDWAKNNLKVNQTEFSCLGPQYFQGDQQLIASTAINQFCRDANIGKNSSWFYFDAVNVNFKNLAPNLFDVGEALISTPAPVYNANSVYTYVDQGPITRQGVGAINSNTSYPANGAEYSPMYKEEFTTFERTALYYAFRRLTQSVTPGSVSRKTTVAASGNTGVFGREAVYAAGFTNPSTGKYCLVVTNCSTTTSYNGVLKIDGLAGTGMKRFNTYYTSSNYAGSAAVNDASWTTDFNNGQATTTLYPRAVYIFVQQ